MLNGVYVCATVRTLLLLVLTPLLPMTILLVTTLATLPKVMVYASVKLLVVAATPPSLVIVLVHLTSNVVCKYI